MRDYAIRLQPFSFVQPVPLPPVGAFDVFNGTNGNDNFTGTGGADTFNMGNGGRDTVSGRGGADTFNFGAELAANDTIDGGNGDDTLVLDGDYSSGLIFGATMLRNVEAIQYTGGNDYFLILDNSNLLLGDTLQVSGTGLGAGDTLTLDGSDETSSALIVFGGFGDDTFIGGGGNDLFVPGPGNDTVMGGDGDDTLNYGANFSGADRITGGDGFDTLVLSGDYSAGVFFGPLTMREVERIVLATTNNYNLTFSNQTVGIAATLTIDATTLAPGNALTLDGSAVADGNLRVLGGNGGDVITIGQGGFDFVRAGGGIDSIRVGGNLVETVRIDGGDADDIVVFDGDYSDKLVLNSNTLRSVETLSLLSGNDYNLAIADGTVAQGTSLSVVGTALGAGDRLKFDGSEESNGALNIAGGAGDDVIAGGAGNDTISGGTGFNRIDASQGGNDTIVSQGTDIIYFGGALGSSDAVTAQANDTIVLDGDYLDSLFFRTVPYTGLLLLTVGGDYKLTTEIPDGDNMIVDGRALGVSDRLLFTATGTGTAQLLGGMANDSLVGGDGSDELGGDDGDDTLDGDGGQDFLYGGDGRDNFLYQAASDSSSTLYDIITSANFSEDRFIVPNDITAIDPAVTTGTLSTATFNTDLINAVTGELAPNHAIVFSPDAGNLSVHDFLIIDINAVGGYQVGSDIVLRISFFTGTVSVGDFG